MNIQVIAAKDMTREQIDAWRRLQAAQPMLDHPLLHPEFTRAVASARGGVEVAVLQQQGEMVGFFPFQRGKGNVAEYPGGCMADMQAVIVSENVDWQIEEVLRAARLSAWHFDHLMASQTALKPYHRSVEDSAIIDLSLGFDHYLEQLRTSGSQFLKVTERKKRKLQREVGPIRFEWHVADEAMLQKLIIHKRSQLQRQGMADPMAAPWVRELLHNLLVRQSDDFQGLLSVLYAGDQPISLHLGIRGGPVLSSAIPAYDECFAKYSPGAILHLEMIEAAAQRGIQRIDLGRGENRLKESLKTGAVPVAIGSVDLRPIRRLATEGWYRARSLAHATPLRGAPLRWFRRARARLGTGAVRQNAEKSRHKAKT